MTKLRQLLANAVVLAALVSCGGGSKEVADPKGTADKIEAPKDDKATDSQLDPGPDAAQALDWVVGKINGGGEVTEAEATEWFSDAFLKQVPYAKLAPLFKQLASYSPVKVLEKKNDGDRKLSALIDSTAGGARINISVNNDVPRKIDGLLIQPAAKEAPPKDLGTAVKILKELGSDVMFATFEIKKGKCMAKDNFNTTASLGIGSTFKLWVLAALDRKISRTKKLTWDTKMPLEDALKSLPSGTMQNEEAGSQFTLREYATKMISISDNTATDHVINFVGRNEVEKMLKRAGHSDPSANIPFLMTREMFAMKLASTDAELDAFRKAKGKAKLKLLDAMRKKEIKLEMATDWTKPRHLDLEWFANGPDICNVFASIGKSAKWKTDSEVMKVLSVNPGVPVNKELWKYVGYKGGSEVGVINLSFLVQRKDDRWFVVTLSVNDKTRPVDEAAAANVATGVLEILGSEK